MQVRRVHQLRRHPVLRRCDPAAGAPDAVPAHAMRRDEPELPHHVLLRLLHEPVPRQCVQEAMLPGHARPSGSSDARAADAMPTHLVRDWDRVPDRVDAFDPMEWDAQGLPK